MHARILIVATIVPLSCLTACRPRDRAAPPETASKPPTSAAPAMLPADAHAEPGPTPALAAEPEVLLSLEADWQGQKQTITLWTDGQLRAGGARGSAQLFSTGESGDSSYFPQLKEEGRLHVVELGHARHRQAILVWLPAVIGEDPPSLHQLFVAHGNTLRRVLNVALDNQLRFPGDGTARYREDRGWEACSKREANESPVASVDDITFGGLAGGEMKELHRVPSGLTVDCSQLAACPFVYIVTREGSSKVGEILRNLRGARAYAAQRLALPLRVGALHLQLREEKPEVTHLDEVSLAVDGQLQLPRACSESPNLSYCRPDGRSLRLDEGDMLDLWFDVPATAGSIALHARGYYVPMPATIGR